MDRFSEMRGKRGGGGSAVIIPPEAGELIEIIVTKTPSRIDYNEGDILNISGLEVTAKYENNVSVDVTNACTVIVNSPLTLSDTAVIVQYEGMSATFGINIYPNSEKIPSGTEYLFNFENGAVNTINSSESIDGAYTSATPSKFGNSGYVTSKGTIWLGRNNIPTPYELVLNKWDDETNTNPVTMTIEYWAYSGSATLQYGNGGDSWSTFGGVQISSSASSSGTTVGVMFKEGTYANYTINEDLRNQWVHVAIVFNASTVTFFINGKKGSTAGLEGGGNGGKSLVFKSGNIDELLISSEALYKSDFEPPTGPYGGERTLEKIYIDTPPTKTIYQIGETFSLDGAVIKAVYSNGLIANVTSDCVIENNTPLTASDTFRKITYTYKDLTKSVYVNVGVYVIEEELDLTATKLLMNFDGNTADLTRLNTPTIVGNNLYGEGKFGQARYFNGSTDYISMPYTEDINIDTGDFTIAFWFKNVNPTKGVHLLNIEKWVTSSTVCGLRITVQTTGGFAVSFTSELPSTTLSLSTSSSCITTNNVWNHVAIVRKQDILTLYINGKKINEVNHTGQLYFGNKVLIGARLKYNSTGYESMFTGYIDDLIITKSALWDSEFTPPSQPYSIVKELEERALYELNDGGGVE